MDPAAFFSSMRAGLLGPNLSQIEVDGCNSLLSATVGWPKDWRAYALATAFHETAHTLQPVSEIGAESYFWRRYDPDGLNPRLARRLGNTRPGDGVRFKGRGYVQLTGRRNYEVMGARLGLGLENEPDLALDPEVAAKILRIGMGEGLFTGKALNDFFCGEKCDPVGARAVINGRDRAHEIARYFRQFRAAL